MKKSFTLIALFIMVTGFSQTTISKSSIDSGGSSSTNGTLSLVSSYGAVVVQEGSVGAIHISEGFLGANLTDSTTGLEDYSQLSGIEMYPNPATDFVNLSFPTTDNYEVEIYNLLNERVGVYHSQNGATQRIELGFLQKSVYLLLIKNTDTKQYKTYKIVKE